MVAIGDESPAGQIIASIYVYMDNGKLSVVVNPSSGLSGLAASIVDAVNAATASLELPNKFAARIDFSVDDSGNLRWNPVIFDSLIAAINTIPPESMVPPADVSGGGGGGIMPGTINPPSSGTIGGSNPTMMSGYQLMVQGDQGTGSTSLVVTVNTPVALSVGNLLALNYSDGSFSGPVYKVTGVVLMAETVTSGLNVRQKVALNLDTNLVQDVADQTQVMVS